MKRLSEWFSGLAGMAILIAVVAIAASIVASPAEAEEYPFKQEVTLPGGGAGTNVISFVYTNGINRAAFSAWRVTDFQVFLDSAATNAGTLTVKHIAGGDSTNAWTTVSVTSNTTYAIDLQTNGVRWNFRDDGVEFSFNLNGGGTVRITGVEK